MIPLLLLAAAAAADPTPEQRADLHCVALLAIVSSEQARGTGWADVAPLKDDGARYAGVVGATITDATGLTREAVRDLIVTEVGALRGAGALPRADVERCIARIAVVAPRPTGPQDR